MITQPNPAQWDAFVAAQPNGHILQTARWGELKARFDWSAEQIAVLSGSDIVAGALVLFRKLPMRLGTLAYIPKGPVLDFDDDALSAELLHGLARLMKRHRAILLKIEPDRLTELRFFTSAFMIWLAVVLVIFVLTVLRGDRRPFATAALVSAFVARLSASAP